MDVKGAKRVKVQIGSKQSLTKSTSSSRIDEPQLPYGSENKALADLCDGQFLKRKIRAKQSLNNPLSGMVKATKNSDKSAKKRLRSQQMNSNPEDYSVEQGPRVEIIDGKIVIKESSLMIDNRNQGGDDGDYEEIEESIHATSRYSSFTSKRSAKVWGIEETRIFYNALRQCGLEFSMMQTFFPNRTRNELKNKFYREEKNHPELVKVALETTLPLDLTPFELLLGEKISMPTETPEIVGSIIESIQ